MNQGYGSAPPSAPRGEGKPNAPDMSLKLLMEVAVGAWTAFAAVCLLFGFAYHSSQTEVWSLIVLGAAVLVIVLGSQWSQRNYNPTAHASVIIAGWLLASVLMGTLVGIFSYDCCIGEYWLSQASRRARTFCLQSLRAHMPTPVRLSLQTRHGSTRASLLASRTPRPIVSRRWPVTSLLLRCSSGLRGQIAVVLVEASPAMMPGTPKRTPELLSTIRAMFSCARTYAGSTSRRSS